MQCLATMMAYKLEIDPPEGLYYLLGEGGYAFTKINEIFMKKTSRYVCTKYVCTKKSTKISISEFNTPDYFVVEFL